MGIQSVADLIGGQWNISGGWQGPLPFKLVWLTGDVVPTVICISTLDWYARGRNSRPPSSPLRVWSINNVALWYFVDVYLLIKVVCGSFLVGNPFS